MDIKESLMNWKAIGIFSFLLFLLGVLSGMLFGMWAANNEQVLNKTWFYYAEDMADFVIGVTVFYHLFKRVANRPLLHAVIVVLISWLAAITIQLVIFGETNSIVLMFVNAFVALTSILVAQVLFKHMKSKKANLEQTTL